MDNLASWILQQAVAVVITCLILYWIGSKVNVLFDRFVGKKHEKGLLDTFFMNHARIAEATLQQVDIGKEVVGELGTLKNEVKEVQMQLHGLKDEVRELRDQHSNDRGVT